MDFMISQIGAWWQLGDLGNLYLVCRVCLCFAGSYNFLGMAETLCHPAWPQPQAASLYSLSLPCLAQRHGDISSCIKTITQSKTISTYYKGMMSSVISLNWGQSTFEHCLGCFQGVTGLRIGWNWLWIISPRQEIVCDRMSDARDGRAEDPWCSGPG